MQQVKRPPLTPEQIRQASETVVPAKPEQPLPSQEAAPITAVPVQPPTPVAPTHPDSHAQAEYQQQLATAQATAEQTLESAAPRVEMSDEAFESQAERLLDDEVVLETHFANYTNRSVNQAESLE